MAALGAALLGVLVPTLTRIGSQAPEEVTVSLAAAPAGVAAAANVAARPGAISVLVADATEPILISRADNGHDLTDAPDLGSVPTAPVDPASVLASGFVRPVEGVITSRYGPRFHPILAVWKLHTGIDIGAACGTPVKAVKDGVVSFAGTANGYGNRVVVEHGKGMATTYNHFSAYAAAAGMQVRQGQIIGYVGTTGLSTGCHLHFEVVINGAIVDAGPYLDLAPAPKVVLPAAMAAKSPAPAPAAPAAPAAPKASAPPPASPPASSPASTPPPATPPAASTPPPSPSTPQPSTTTSSTTTSSTTTSGTPTSSTSTTTPSTTTSRTSGSASSSTTKPAPSPSTSSLVQSSTTTVDDEPASPATESAAAR